MTPPDRPKQKAGRAANGKGTGKPVEPVSDDATLGPSASDADSQATPDKRPSRARRAPTASADKRKPTPHKAAKAADTTPDAVTASSETHTEPASTDAPSEPAKAASRSRARKSSVPPRPAGDDNAVSLDAARAARSFVAASIEDEEDVFSDSLASSTDALDPALGDLAAAGVDPRESEPAARLTRSSSQDAVREAAAFGSSQSLLSTDYYFRQYGAHGIRSLSAEIDDFGFDPHVDEKTRPTLEAVCRRYFRVELIGAEHVPVEGPALLVANRSGALPWDGLVLRTALRAKRPSLPPLRWLSEDSVIHYPFMGVLMNRLGAVRACPENAERLLAQRRLVAVFPEGAQGSRKLFRDRYRLQRFGRGGYVKLALKFGVPILPTAIIGAEETNPVLGRSRLLGRLIGSESVPITPTFPLLGLAGLLPAPVRWRIAIGAPVDLSNYGPSSADDALVVHRLNEQIRSSLQALVDQGKSARGGTFFA